MRAGPYVGSYRRRSAGVLWQNLSALACRHMDDTSPDLRSEHGPVTVTVLDGVAIIDIDDGKANALGFAVLDGLDAALDRASEDDIAAVAVIGREGKFSAGFDLSVMTSGPAAARDMLGRGAEIGLRLVAFPKPVVFGVTGHALAMGAILLCCADVRIGADGPFKIGLNEVAIGMPVPAFAVEVCRARLSVPAFNRAVQLAHIHSPAEAHAAGFLDEVVDAGQVRDRAIAVAAELGERLHAGPFRVTRRTVRGEMADALHTELVESLSNFAVSD